VADRLLDSSDFVIKSTAAASLVSINTLSNFPASLQKGTLDIYIKAIENGDPAVIGTVADALINPSLKYKEVVQDWNFLYEAKAGLNLPRDVESLEPLEKAIAYFEGKDFSPSKNSYNHPIDWSYVKTIPKDQMVLIKTTKGNIVLELFVEEAPGSVSNFLKLADDNYFDSKFFHRVVPNFVIQTGCKRGDGWGSEDYSIRSEFSTRRYKRGSVGMASAGKDTEGTQWFITHSPTPHLDGRYTIFAEVRSGMDVVDQIEVGDQILDVSRFESSPK
jgi:cyclophilin family peptidyl-prolyl cis-trans isomerase